MATIPISQIVTVNPAVLEAAGSAIDMNGVILSESPYLPIGQAVSFASADDVRDYTGPMSVEREMAAIYFNGYTGATRKPGCLYLFRYANDPVAAFLRSGSLSSMTLEDLQALSGDLTVTIDGAEETAAALDFSAVTSFSEAATQIGTGLGVTCEFDSLFSAFIITSGTTGETSTITYATGSLSEDLKLTQTDGATISQGADVSTPATAMDALTNQTQNWGVFTSTFEPELADKQALSDWTNDQGDRYAYAGWDTDVNAETAGSTDTWGAYLVDNDVSGSIPVYGNYEQAAFVLAWAASLDFTRLNGRSTLAFRRQSGMEPSVTNASVASALEENGYNFYGSYANSNQQFNFMYPGVISGTWDWADTYINQIWLNANLQLSMINLLLNVGSIPYNQQGYSLVYAAAQDPIDAGVNFGAIRAGVTLSESQRSQIQFALGIDPSRTIEAQGYYLQVSDASAATRSERQSPPITLYYTDGGSIHRITLASIAVQ